MIKKTGRKSVGNQKIAKVTGAPVGGGIHPFHFHLCFILSRTALSIASDESGFRRRESICGAPFQMPGAVAIRAGASAIQR
jgi:hypothetical protein